MKPLQYFFLISLFPFYANAQFQAPIINDSVPEGRINIIQDPLVDSLMEISRFLNQADPHIDGYRIEIFFESGNQSHTHALEEKANFVQNYPDIPVYITFQAPNYKVRIGDFRIRLEAEAYLQKIKGHYPGAWVVADRITLPVLRKQEEE